MRRLILLVATACILLTQGGAEPADSGSWNVSTISKSDSHLHAKLETGDTPGPLKYLHLHVDFPADTADKQLHKFRVVDSKGKPVGEMFGANPNTSQLVFERDTPWASLNGLYLDGLGRRVPLFATEPLRPAPTQVVRPAPVPTPTGEEPRSVYVPPAADNVVRVAPTYIPPQTDTVVVDPMDRVVVHGDRNVVVHEHVGDTDRPVFHTHVGGGGGGGGVGGHGHGHGGGVGAGGGAGGGCPYGDACPICGTGSEDSVESLNPWAFDEMGQGRYDDLLARIENSGSTPSLGGVGLAGGGAGSGGGSGLGGGRAGGGGVGPAGAAGLSSGAGTNVGTGPSSGPLPGMVANGSASGRGSGAGPGAGPGMGAGSVPGMGSGSGSGSGQGVPGMGPGSGGPGSGSGEGAGQGSGSGMGPGAGAGQGPGPGEGQGPGPGEGQGPGPQERFGTPGQGGPGAGPGPGSGPGMMAGPVESAPREMMPNEPIPGENYPMNMDPMNPMANNGAGSGGGGGGANTIGPQNLFGPRVENLADPRVRFHNLAPEPNLPNIDRPTLDLYGYRPTYTYFDPRYQFDPRYRLGQPGYGYGGGGGGGAGYGAGGRYADLAKTGLPEMPELPEMLPETVLYISAGNDGEQGGKIYQVNDTGRVLGIINLPYQATGLALHRNDGLIAVTPRDRGKIYRVDDKGILSVIMEGNSKLPYPVDVGVAGDSDSILVADSMADVLAATDITGRDPIVYERFETAKYEQQKMSVAVTRDMHVMYGTDAGKGIYRFGRNQDENESSASLAPILPNSGGVAADPKSLKWAATQSPNLIHVYEGTMPVKTFKLGAGRSIYRQGLLSFAPSGAVVVATRPSDEVDRDVWLLAYEVAEGKDGQILSLFEWDKERMLDFVVGPRMIWEGNTPTPYESKY